RSQPREPHAELRHGHRQLMRAAAFIRVASGAALIVAAAALAGTTGCERSCKPDTLYLQIALGYSKGADPLDGGCIVAGSTAKHTTRMISPSASTGTLEIEFPSGYPEGKRVDLTLVASKNGTSIGATSANLTLASGCTRASIAFPGGNVTSGSGGNSG